FGAYDAEAGGALASRADRRGLSAAARAGDVLRTGAEARGSGEDSTGDAGIEWSESTVQLSSHPDGVEGGRNCGDCAQVRAAAASGRMAELRAGNPRSATARVAHWSE